MFLLLLVVPSVFGLGCDFDSPGNNNIGGVFDCDIERPEQYLVNRWLEEGANVLEFGTRFGHTTCAISEKLAGTGNIVTIEPDHSIWNYTRRNLKRHHCNANFVEGVLGNEDESYVVVEGEYGTRVVPQISTENILNTIKSEYQKRNFRDDVSTTVIPTTSLSSIEMNMGVVFDTLIIDCEGCVFEALLAVGKSMANVRTIILEADMSDLPGSDCTYRCVDYNSVFRELSLLRFQQMEMVNDCERKKTGLPLNKTCYPWIDHFVFKR